MNNDKSYWINEKLLAEKQLEHAHEYHDGFDSEDDYDDFCLNRHEYIEYCEQHINA